MQATADIQLKGTWLEVTVGRFYSAVPALDPQSECGKPATAAGDWILEGVQCHKWPLP